MINAPTSPNADDYVSELRATPVVENPYPYYAALRAAGPVSYAKAHDIWVVSRYDACAAVLRSSTSYRELDNPWLERWHAVDDATARTIEAGDCPVVGHAVGQAKEGLSRLSPREMMVNRAAILAQHAMVDEPRLRLLAAKLIDTFLADGHVEFVSQFAQPLVTAVISELFGLPPDVWTSYFDAWYEKFRPTIDPRRRAQQDFLNPWNSFPARQAAWNVAIATGLADRRTRPSDDALGAIARLGDIHDPEGDRDIPKLVARFATSAVVSTGDFLGNALWLIVQTPEVCAHLLADSSLMPNAVDEALRLEPSISALFFQARAATELGGSRIPAGARLIVLLASANRDDQVFPDPERFDLLRPNAPAHLAFSLGTGRCCGTPLVRRLGIAALGTVLTSLRGLRLRENQGLTHFAKRYNRGFRRLWFEFDRR